MCLVSVIVPVYNVEKYLEKCLDSIINQTYEDIEIILIDDGSQDNSGAICDVYAKRDNRILVIHKENTGVSDTRNKGIDVAQGKYICFIDSDDTVSLSYIEKLVQPTRHEDYDLVICNFQKLFPDKVLDMSFSNIKCFSGVFIRDYQFLYTITSFPCGKLYKASVIKGKNIIFPVDFPDAEDQMFNFQYYCYVKKYCLINEPLYYYWQRSGSASKNNSLKSFECNLLKLKYEKSFYKNNHIEDYGNLLISSCLLLTKKYVLLRSYDNCYNAYKERVDSVIKVAEEELNQVQFNNFSKRNIAALCLKYRIYFILYLWYRIMKIIKQ